MASSALPTTLRSITATKIVELKKQRNEFEYRKTDVLETIKRQKTTHDRSATLVREACKLEGVILIDRNNPLDEDAEITQMSTPAVKLRNQYRLLQQSLIDPSFPTSQVEAVQKDITHDLELKSTQHSHAQFFSELVTEWISEDTELDNDKDDDKFQKVGRKEMHEQRAEWEKIVFGGKEVDADAVQKYLEDLFTGKDHVKRAVRQLQKTTRSFSKSFLTRELFTVDVIKIQIKGLLAMDLLNSNKRSILKTFLANKEILKEVCDVLNMRFKSLATWDWTTEDGAINVEQRRQLNGKYRVFMDEDVLDAIMVHYIGIEWAVHFRSVLSVFFNSHAWSRNEATIPVADRERRKWFLGKHESTNAESVRTRRSKDYARDYFMTQLPDSINSAPRAYDDSGSDDGHAELVDDRKGPLETKHDLLRLLIAEALLARHLHPETQHTVIRSDFKWFGPSLPHQSIFQTLKFFGVTSEWLDFFRKFLCVPLRFVQDGARGEIKTRAAGVPMSHSLADTMSEVVLFVMDFAVSNATQTNLYRLHDDFWFWGSLDHCRFGWNEMEKFASTMGIEFNEEKTGSVVFSNADDSDSEMADDVPGLPTGEVRWGFLKLDPSTYRFTIDQANVDVHIEELKLQLNATKSIFGYIQAYNAYCVRFFTNNFGQPCFAFGRQHVDDMLSTFKRIHQALYTDGRVSSYLSALAEQRFNTKAADIPDGFWYFPIANGGMEVRNPFVPLLNARESFRYSPERILEKALERDEDAYRTAMTTYNTHGVGFGMGSAEHTTSVTNYVGRDEKFMSREEYFRYREERSRHLLAAYKDLLGVPSQDTVEGTPNVEALLVTMSVDRDRKSGIRMSWDAMDAYWQWMVTVYGKEIADRYGGLQLVQPSQVPLGVVSVMRAGKVRWQG